MWLMASAMAMHDNEDEGWQNMDSSGDNDGPFTTVHQPHANNITYTIPCNTYYIVQ